MMLQLVNNISEKIKGEEDGSYFDVVRRSWTVFIWNELYEPGITEGGRSKIKKYTGSNDEE